MADLAAFIRDYLAKVYDARDPEAARNFIGETCVRRTHGETLTISIDDNVARIRAFQTNNPDFVCTVHQVFGGTDHAVLCYDLDWGDGVWTSATEVFRIVDGRIVENWNTRPLPNAWG